MGGAGGPARRVLAGLEELTASGGVPPTIRELAAHLDLAVGTVHAHLRTLRAAGLVTWPQGRKARCVQVLRPSGPQPDPGVMDLTAHRIAAGPPSAVADLDEAVRDAGGHLADGDEFWVRAQGDSMIGAGILDGDILVVRVQRTAQDGDIVVATVPDTTTGEPRATVKRLSRRGGRVRLIPANPAYAPIESDGLVIVGRVTDVWRCYSGRASAKLGELPIEDAPPWIRGLTSSPAQVAAWHDKVRRFLAGEPVEGVGWWDELKASWHAEDQ